MHPVIDQISEVQMELFANWNFNMFVCYFEQDDFQETPSSMQQYIPLIIYFVLFVFRT